MLSLDAITKLIGYTKSDCFRTKVSQFEPEAVQLFRFAKEKEEADENFNVKGFYVLKTAAGNNTSFAARPAICVAEADTSADAQKLHRRIWNLGSVPFLMVRLPQEIRIYAGFHYNHSKDEAILIERSEDEREIQMALSDFSADSIDSAHIWQAQRQHLDTKHRVDTTLLENLNDLALALAKHCVPVLDLEVAHALIGKFVYLRYLRDRNILDDGWLKKRNIKLDQVFGGTATVSELSRLVEALENRFNGDIFHIDFGLKCPLADTHVQLVASVFAGGDVRVNPMGYVHQLHLRFQAFDFRHIPVEMLSSIYEQFLHSQKKGKSDGAYYTPEVLADYLLSEVDSVRALQRGMTVCDTACGSGIFLVLAYRRLIELELVETKNRSGSLDPMRLREILWGSIYGVERQRDACNVTIFSLILTLLNYLEPPALHANEKFQFPALLNKRIYCDDFFNPRLELPIPKSGFDIIVGNPPWIELKPGTKAEKYARDWIVGEKIIAGNRVADAFAVKAGRLLGKDGVAGLLLPASTLFNLENKSYRQAFFQEFAVARMTNLANLRGNLFGRRAILPTTTLVFAKSDVTRVPRHIVHHGPFAANQVAADAEELWVLTIHSSEIQLVPQSDAITGETSVWKLALWGTPRDARSLDRLRQLYPLTLAKFCEQRGWGKRMPRQGAELRNISKIEKDENDNPKEELVYCKELEGEKRFDLEKFNRIVKSGLHFSFPPRTLVDISKNECYARKRGGLNGLVVNKPPHLFISATWKNFLIFSENYQHLPPRQMAIAAPKGQEELLRALAVYLASSAVDYFVFFQVPEWGVYSTFPHVALRGIRKIPTPDFSEVQINILAKTHREILNDEKAFRLESDDVPSAAEKQRCIDRAVFEALNMPDDVRTTVEDFRDNRLPLDNGYSALKKLGRPPGKRDLQAYGRTLCSEMERFLLGEAYPFVRILFSDDLICCELQLLPQGSQMSESIEVVDAGEESNTKAAYRELRKLTSEKFSQWAYVDRSVRVFGEDTVQLFKSPRLMDWTRTQALNDADAIIAEILAEGK